MRNRPPISQLNHRRGFSLMEAMVVLLVAGMALTLLFSIAGRAAQIGFGLGGRALAQADKALAEESLRVAVRALLIPVTPRPEEVSDARRAFKPQPPQLSGAPRGFQGPAVFDRPTLCAGRGPARPLQVWIDRRGGHEMVLCRASGPETELIDLGGRAARFVYSADGVRWSPRWPLATSFVALRAGSPQSVHVRLITDDGTLEITERARSLVAAGQISSPGSADTTEPM